MSQTDVEQSQNTDGSGTKSTFRSMTSAFNNDDKLLKQWTDLAIKPEGHKVVTIDTLKKMDPDARKILKNAIIKQEGLNRVEAVTDQGMGEDELGTGKYTLVFIGAGSGGSAQEFNQNMTMKNNLYYAGIIEDTTYKITTSKNNSVSTLDDEQKNSLIEIISLTKSAIINVEKSKEDSRNRIKTLSEALKEKLPADLKGKLKFANQRTDGLQIVLKYDKDGDSINGTGRIQFVKSSLSGTGDAPVSSYIEIKNNVYSFDRTKMNEFMGEQGVETAKVLGNILGKNLESKEDAIKRTEAEITNVNEQISTSDEDDKEALTDKLNALNASLIVLKGNVGGKKRKTYRKKNMSKAKRSKVAKKTRKTYKKMKHTKR